MRRSIILTCLSIVPLLWLAAVHSAETSVSEKSYTMAKCQGEALTMLLRLELPQHTTVKPTYQGEAFRLVVTGPPEVHEAIGAFVDFLDAAAGAAARKRFEARKAQGRKFDAIRAERERARIKERKQSREQPRPDAT